MIIHVYEFYLGILFEGVYNMQNTQIVYMYIPHTLLCKILVVMTNLKSNVMHLNCGSEDLCGILQVFGLEEAQDGGLHSASKWLLNCIVRSST